MNDLISREEAIKRATTDHDFYRGATLPTDKARRDELLNVMCWLNELPPAEPQWIPVGERLPGHDECIKNNKLFNVSDGHRSYSEWFDYDKQRFGEYTMAGFRIDYAVIAWMPLPNSYIENKE